MIMKPNEKAKELIFRFYDIEKNDGYFDYPLFIFCQKCALIAVDEMIKSLPYGYSERRFYLDEVEKEIQNYNNETISS